MTNSGDLTKAIQFALSQESNRLLQPYIPANSRDYGCSVDGCANRALAKGYCNAHYLRARAGRDMTIPVRHSRAIRECTECGERVDIKGGWGLCKRHYASRRRKVIRAVCIEALGGCCMRCGGTFPHPVYDFHHPNRADKLFTIGSKIGVVSIARMAEEVSRCLLFCANCHRIELYVSD